MKPVPRPAPTRARQWAAVAIAGLLAIAGVVAISPLWNSATAEDDDMTESSVTVNGRMGTLGDDYRNLTVTVSQTRDLANQGVTVTWTGAIPTRFTWGGGQFTSADPIASYLQIMQCWGPNPDAADFRETCEWGVGRRQEGDATKAKAGRQPVPSDPLEPLADDARMVPFRSALDNSRTPDGSSAQPFPPSSVPGFPVAQEWEVLGSYFGVYTTNEIPYAVTGGDGTGRVTFEVRNAIRDPHLGCGRRPEGGGGDPRTCWLVIVPRGSRDIDTSQPDTLPDRSPLAASIFADKLVVPLEFTPLDAGCRQGAAERRTVGTELVAEAIASWQPVLCAGTGPVFGYSFTGDADATAQVLDPSEGAPGLAFVADPVSPEEGQPPVVQAPVTISSVVIAVNIDLRLLPAHLAAIPPEVERLRRTLVRDVKLTPRLVAKLLTQSYARDVPDGNNKDHVKNNPRSIRHDPEFLALNPAFKYTENSFAPDGVMVSYGNFAAAREVWRWILADVAARRFLAGEPDEPSQMRINPNYAFISANAAPDYFPKNDPSCLPPQRQANLEDWQQEPPPGRCTEELFPYTSTIAEAAYQALRAETKQASEWQPPLSEGTQGRYGRLPPKPIGLRFALSITDSASAARYGLATAQLCKAVPAPDGTLMPEDCRKPDTEGMLTAAGAMVPSDIGSGVRVVDPDIVRTVPGAYPLTMVSYAAADLSEPAAARADYASLLRYAAGAGQESGHQRGQLPPGYAPLPQNLRAQTQRAADTLQQYVPSPSPSPTPSPAASSASPTPTATAVPNPGVAPSFAPTSAVPTPAPGREVAQTAPGSPAGGVRFVLLGLLVAGLAGALVGPVLLLIGRHVPARNRSG